MIKKIYKSNEIYSLKIQFGKVTENLYLEFLDSFSAYYINSNDLVLR